MILLIIAMLVSTTSSASSHGIQGFYNIKPVLSFLTIDKALAFVKSVYSTLPQSGLELRVDMDMKVILDFKFNVYLVRIVVIVTSSTPPYEPLRKLNRVIYEVKKSIFLTANADRRAVSFTLAY